MKRIIFSAFIVVLFDACGSQRQTENTSTALNQLPPPDMSREPNDFFITETGDSISVTPSLMIDELPEPIGGIAAIQRNVVFPDSAKSRSFQGTVYVYILIDEDGNVTHTKVMQGIGYGFDEAAVSAIRVTKFIPGRIKGKPVASTLLIPMRFTMLR